MTATRAPFSPYLARQAVRGMYETIRTEAPTLPLDEVWTRVLDSISRCAARRPADAEDYRAMWREAQVGRRAQLAGPSVAQDQIEGDAMGRREAAQERAAYVAEMRAEEEGPAARIMRLARSVGAV